MQFNASLFMFLLCVMYCLIVSLPGHVHLDNISEKLGTSQTWGFILLVVVVSFSSKCQVKVEFYVYLHQTLETNYLSQL